MVIIRNLNLISFQSWTCLIDCNVYKQGAKTTQYTLEIITHKYNYD